MPRIGNCQGVSKGHLPVAGAVAAMRKINGAGCQNRRTFDGQPSTKLVVACAPRKYIIL